MKLWSWFKNKFKKSGIVAVIRLEGVISTGGRFGGGINDQSLSPLIEKAFELGRLKAVALVSILLVVHHLGVTNRQELYVYPKKITGFSFF